MGKLFWYDDIIESFNKCICKLINFKYIENIFNKYLEINEYIFVNIWGVVEI